MDREQIVDVPVGAVQPFPLNPRKHAGDLRELTESVRQKGVIQPIIVRPAPDNGRFQVIAGVRRLLAARAAELKAVPAIVRPLTDEEALEVSLIENLQRKDVTPLEEAAGFDQLRKMGLPVEKIAERVGGKTRVSYIYASLKLLDLQPKPRKALEDGAIPATHAVLIARMIPELQDAGLEACFDDRYEPGTNKKVHELVSTRTFEAWIKKNAVLDVLAADAGTSLPTKVARLVQDMQAHGTPPLLVARAKEGYHGVDREVRKLLPKNLKPKLEGDWKPTTKGACTYAQPAIIVQGQDEPEVVTVCADKQCKRHFPKKRKVSYSYGVQPESPEKKAAREQRELRAKATQARVWKVATAIVTAIAPKVKKVEPQDLAALYERAARGAYGDTGALKMAALKPIGVTLADKAPAKADQLAAAVVVDNLLGGFPYQPTTVPKAVLAAAKRFGVNAAAIEKEIVAAERAATKKAPATAKAPPAKKARAKKPAKKAR